MTLIQSTKSNFNTSMDSHMTDVRKPEFIDNAVHYSKITEQSVGNNIVTITNKQSSKYSISTEKAYNMSELQSTLLFTHSENSYKKDIWSPRGKNQIPKIIYGQDDINERLIWDSAESTNKGLRVELKNMKGKSVKEIGFKSKKVHFGTSVDVGFRTTDIITRLTKDIDGDLNSTLLGKPLSIANNTRNRRNLSNDFVALDFNNVNLLSSLKFISRHDNRLLNFTKEGNLLYTPFNDSGQHYSMDRDLKEGKESKDPISSTANRISITGVPNALNDDVSITIDDREKQQGVNSNDVVATSPIFDATIKSKKAARKMARNILQANSVQQGSISIEKVPDKFYIRPGDMINYSGTNYVVSETTHRTITKDSDFKFLLVDDGVEGILQNIEKDAMSLSSLSTVDTKTQIQTENFNFFNSLEINVTPLITIINVDHEKLLLGENSGRRGIGGASTIQEYTVSTPAVAATGSLTVSSNSIPTITRAVAATSSVTVNTNAFPLDTGASGSIGTILFKTNPAASTPPTNGDPAIQTDYVTLKHNAGSGSSDGYNLLCINPDYYVNLTGSTWTKTNTNGLVVPQGTPISPNSNGSSPSPSFIVDTDGDTTADNAFQFILYQRGGDANATATNMMAAINANSNQAGTATIPYVGAPITINSKSVNAASAQTITMAGFTTSNFTLTGFTGGADAVYTGDYLQLISTDGTTKKYHARQRKADGTSVTNGMTETINSVNYVLFRNDLSPQGVAGNLKAAILHANGHNNKIAITRDGNVLSLTQATVGTDGNRTTTIGGSMPDIAKTNFTGGVNLAYVDAYITLSDGSTVKKYHATPSDYTINTGDTATENGHALVYYKLGANTAATALELKAAIESSNGHNNGFILAVDGSNSSKINLTNSSAGTVGNVAITKTSNLNNIVAFTGMSNGTADQFSNVSREIQNLGLNKSLPITIIGDK